MTGAPSRRARSEPTTAASATSEKLVAGHNYADSEHPGRVEALTYDASGNLYLLSDYEETDVSLRRIDAKDLGTGLMKWQADAGEGGANAAVATDGMYVYTARNVPPAPGVPGSATLHRFDAGNGSPADPAAWTWRVDAPLHLVKGADADRRPRGRRELPVGDRSGEQRDRVCSIRARRLARQHSRRSRPRWCSPVA